MHAYHVLTDAADQIHVAAALIYFRNYTVSIYA